MSVLKPGDLVAYNGHGYKVCKLRRKCSLDCDTMRFRACLHHLLAFPSLCLKEIRNDQAVQHARRSK